MAYVDLKIALAFMLVAGVPSKLSAVSGTPPNEPLSAKQIRKAETER